MLLPGTHRFKLAGGHPVLDFLNSMGGHRLTVEIHLRPAEARAALVRVRAFREALFRVFLAVSEDVQPAAEPLEILEREARRAWAERRLVRTPEHDYRWMSPESARLDAFIPGLALAASELVTGPER